MRAFEQKPNLGVVACVSKPMHLVERKRNNVVICSIFYFEVSFFAFRFSHFLLLQPILRFDSLPVSILLRFYATAEGEHIVESILFNYVLGLSLCSCAFCSPFEILYFVEMHACAYCLCAFTLSAVYRSISFTLDIAPRSLRFSHSNSAHFYMKHNVFIAFSSSVILSSSALMCIY